MARRWLFAIPVFFGCTLAPAAAQANCEFRYASKWAEVAGTIEADLKAEALKAVSSGLQSTLGDKASATAKLDARYSIMGAGGMAEEAYSETVSDYLCKLRERWAGEPEKLAKLDEAGRQIDLVLSRYFDVGLYIGEGTYALRDGIRKELAEMKPSPPPFSAVEIDRLLPNPNFDLVKITNLTANADLPGVAGIETCLGFVRRSIRKVDGSVLSGLSMIRPMLIKWLGGDNVSARLDMWRFATNRMTAQVIAANRTEDVVVTPPFLACVKKAEAAAVQEQANAHQQVPQPATTDQQSGAASSTDQPAQTEAAGRPQ